MDIFGDQHSSLAKVSRVRNYGWNKRKGAGKILIYGMRSLLGI
jgi:hypothetical protein